MENTAMEPNEEILNALDEIVAVNTEEVRRKTGKRSSILKRPKSTDDDLQTEDLQNKRKSINSKRVSFAEKFQVMEMNTGNIYDISGKSNSTLTKDSTQNENLLSESKSDVFMEEDNASENGISRNNLQVPSAIEICLRESEDYSQSSCSRKHKINSDHDLEPERKKLNHQSFSLHLKSGCVFTHPNEDISDFKSYLFNTSIDYNRYEVGNQDMELTSQDADLNSMKSNLQERHNEDGRKFIENNSPRMLKSNSTVQEAGMSLQSRNVPWDQQTSAIIKNAFEEFDSKDAFLPFIKNEQNFELAKELPDVQLCPISVSDIPFAENKENIYVDVENKSILVTNARQLKLTDNTPLQVSQCVKNPSLESQISSHFLSSSKTNPLDGKNCFLGPGKLQALSCEEENSNADKTCMFNNTMDLTCVSEKNAINYSKYAADFEDSVNEDDGKPHDKFSITHENSSRDKFKDNQSNKTIFDTSQYMDLTCRPEDLTNIESDVPESSVKGVSNSASSELVSEQNDDVTYKNSFGSQYKNDKTVFDTSHYMELTCNPQDLRNILPDAPEDNVKDTSKDAAEENDVSKDNVRLHGKSSVTHENSSGSKFKNDQSNKTIFVTSEYMDLTCRPKDLTNIESDVPESSVKDVSILASSELVSEQNVDATYRNSFGNRDKDDKTMFDTPHYMDLPCNPQNLRNIVTDASEDNVKENTVLKSSKLMSQQNDDVTYKNSSGNGYKDDVIIFDTSHCMEMTCNPQDLINIPDSPESVNNDFVSKSSKLTTQQNADVVCKNNRTIFDSSHCMDLTCNLEDLRNVSNAPESNVDDASVSKSSKLTTQQNDGKLLVAKTAEQNQNVIIEIADTGKDEKNAVGTLDVSNEELRKDKLFAVQPSDILNIEIVHVVEEEEKLSIDKTHLLRSSMQLTYLPPKLDLTGKLEDLIEDDHVDEKNISLHNNSSVEHQLNNNQKLLVQNDFVDNQLNETKFDTSHYMELTCNEQDLMDDVPESYENNVNHAFGSNYAGSSREHSDENCHNSFFVKQNGCMLRQKCITELAELDTSSKKNALNKELENDSVKTYTLESSNLWNVQTDEEMLDSSSVKNQNPQKLGEYMFVNTLAERNCTFSKKVENNVNEKFGNDDPNLFNSEANIRDNAFGKELENDTNKIFISKSNLLKGHADAEVGNSAILSVGNTQKSEKDMIVIAETSRKSVSSKKVENKADEDFDCHKTKSPVSLEVPNDIHNVIEAREDFCVLDSKENNPLFDNKLEVNNQSKPSDPNIVYAIKQLKGMNQAETSCNNIFKFPEVFLSVRKQPMPRKRPFSCSSIQLTKAVRDYIRQSSSFSNRELSFISEFKQDTLAEDECNADKIDKNMSKGTEKPCNSASELSVHCGIPSTSQIVRSASKTIKKKLFITYCQSPKQIASSDETDIPQTCKTFSSVNKSSNALSTLKKSLNFENEINNNLPIAVSSTRENSVAKNEDIFLDSSELLLDNCSISLVTNDDSLDSRNINLNSKITRSEHKLNHCLSLPHEELSHQSVSGVSGGSNEVFVQSFQNKIEKKNNVERCKNIYQKNNSNVMDIEEIEFNNVLIDETKKSISDLSIVSLSKLPVRQNDENCQNSFAMQENQSILKQTFSAEMVDDEKNKTNVIRLKLDSEIQNAPKTQNMSTTKIVEESCNSAFQKKENLCKLGESITVNVNMDKNHEVNKTKKDVNERLILNSSKILENDHKECHKLSEVISKQSHVMEVSKGDENSSLNKEPENNIITALTPNPLKRKSNEDNVPFLKENNPCELKREYKIASMEVDENPVLNIIREKDVGEELIPNASKSLRSQIDTSSQSFMEKQNQCVVTQKCITEITIIEKHTMLNNETEDGMHNQLPSKLLKTENTDEIYSTSVVEMRKPCLLEENSTVSTNISSSEVNERPEDSADAVLSFNSSKVCETKDNETFSKLLERKNNEECNWPQVEGKNLYTFAQNEVENNVSESFVLNSSKLLTNQDDKKYHKSAGAIDSTYNVEQNHVTSVTKGARNFVQNKSPESSRVVTVKPNASKLFKSKHIYEQGKENNSDKLKQDCINNVNVEVIENHKLNKPFRKQVDQKCPLNLSKAQNEGGSSALFMDHRNLSIIEEYKSNETQTVGNPPANKKPDETEENNINICSSNPHFSCLQLEKECFISERSNIEDINMEDCTPVSDNAVVANNSFKDDYERIHTLRKMLIKASQKEGCLWSLREMDDKYAVFEILGDGFFACYLMYVSLDDETSSCAKISYKHMKSEPDKRDDVGFSLFKCYATPEITFSPFCADKLVETLSKIVDYALMAKSLIRDIWLVAIRTEIISVDNSQDAFTLTVKVCNDNHLSVFSLTFSINFRSYPQEKIIPKVQHLDCEIMDNETILNALKEIQPGRNYLSRMIKAANAL